MTRTGWIALGTVVAVGAGIYASRGAWQDAASERSKRDEAVAEMRAEEANKAELRRRLAEAETPAGRERLARERGMRRPEETPAGSGK
jgi:hypothetical protein